MINDLKYAVRMLIKAPAFALIAIVTLALGIGANSAIFSVVDTLLLQPLPFKDPDRIVNVWARASGEVRGTGVHSFPDYVDLRDQNQSVAPMAVYTRTGAVLSHSEEAQELEGLAVTAEIFDVLGVQPLLGRGFTAEEDVENGPAVVVLTHGVWRRAFGGDPTIVGQQITLTGRSHTVLGVMPPGWKFPIEDERIDYVVPLKFLVAASLNNRAAHFLTVVGRLKAGATIQEAEAEMSAIGARLSKQFPDSNTGWQAVSIRTLHSDAVGDVRPALLILFGAVALVLLIACANVANLLLARAASRSREIAIRTALGASRALVVRQLLCESLLIALLGGAGGLMLAWWGIDLLGVLGPRGLPHIGEIRVNFTVGAFTFLLAIASTLLFGLIPALQVSRPGVNEALQQGAKGSTGGLHTTSLRAALVISQVSLSLLLLAGAGLLIKSFFNLRATNPGFEPQRLVSAFLNLPRIHYSDPEKQIRTHELIFEKLAAIPGVEAVGAANPFPLSGNSRTSSMMVSGLAPRPRGEHPEASHITVMGDYFRAMKIPLRSGRTFNRADTKDSPLVIMINEAFARKFFPDRNPIGQHVMVDRPEGEAPPREVIGVVGNTRHNSLQTEADPEMYLPLTQDPTRGIETVFRVPSTNLVGLDLAVKRAVQEVDKTLFVPKLEPVTSLLSTQLAQPRFNMVLLGVFASVAMILAAIGIYGVIAYGVAQRTREIGIRMALGAQKTQMLRMILRQSLTLVGIGLAIGFLVALGATRIMATLLYGVGATDWSTYALVVLLLGAAAFLASYIPARRAMRVDPMVALRYE